MIVSRGAATVMVEPYAENIVRVSISLLKPDATAAPGYGITARPLAERMEDRCGRERRCDALVALVVTVAPQQQRHAHREPRRTLRSSSTDRRRRGHLHQHCGWRDTAGYARLADGGAKLQGRNRRNLNDRRANRRRLLSGRRNLRLAERRARLRPGPEPGGISRPSRPRRALLRTTTTPRRPERLRAVCGHQQRLRPGVGQSRQDDRAARLQRGDRVDLRCGPARVILRDRGQDVRRDLLRLQPADRRRADAAQVGLRLHPVQAAIHQPGRIDGRGQRLSRPPSARGRTGDRLVPLHQDGRDGHGSRRSGPIPPP